MSVPPPSFIPRRQRPPRSRATVLAVLLAAVVVVGVGAWWLPGALKWADVHRIEAVLDRMPEPMPNHLQYTDTEAGTVDSPALVVRHYTLPGHLHDPDSEATQRSREHAAALRAAGYRVRMDHGDIYAYPPGCDIGSAGYIEVSWTDPWRYDVRADAGVLAC